MEAKFHDYRSASVFLKDKGDCWADIAGVVEALSAQDIVEKQAAIALASVGGEGPAGGQTAINALFRERLSPLGWSPEPALFERTSGDYKGWKMDFFKQGVGVEVAFNHAEAIPWNFIRLHLAGESGDVRADHQIDVGVAIFATRSLKKWARMDSAVGTFEKATIWLDLMRPILPVPIMVVGLDAAEWEPVPTTVFRGTKKKSKTSQSDSHVSG